MVSIYVKAIGVLRTDGWCRGLYQNAAGECCLIGSLAKGATGKANPLWGHRTEISQADELLKEILLERGEIMTPEQYYSAVDADPDTPVDTPLGVIDWNDQLGRTVEQVIELLEEADRRVTGTSD